MPRSCSQMVSNPNFVSANQCGRWYCCSRCCTSRSIARGSPEVREKASERSERSPQANHWILPVRHSLGAALMQERRFAEAEQVYREDLARLPDNGWSLFGLAQSLHRQGKEEEAAATDARFQKIWSKADVQIKSSCQCQPGV